MSEAQDPAGRITIAPQVLTTIVRQAALSVEGVKRLSHKLPRRRRLKGRRAAAPGVEVILASSGVHTAVHISAEPGANMMRLAAALQTEITRAIEHMVGLPVGEVSVFIDEVSTLESGKLQP